MVKIDGSPLLHVALLYFKLLGYNCIGIWELQKLASPVLPSRYMKLVLILSNNRFGLTYAL
jgi:hypothetical protein